MSNDPDKKQPEVPQPETKSTATDPVKPEVNQGAEPWTGLIVLLFWGAVGLVITWVWIPGGKQFLKDHLLAAVIVAAALLALVLVGPTRRWFKLAGPTPKPGIPSFVLFPLSFSSPPTLFFYP